MDQLATKQSTQNFNTEVIGMESSEDCGLEQRGIP
jgi:hypothetical protein